MSFSRIAGGGIAGGVLGGTVMTLILIASKAMVGLPALTDFMVMGAFVGGGVGEGFAAHYLVAVVGGALFAVVTYGVASLRLNNIRKSVLLGLLLGIVLFFLLFIPVLMFGFSPIMMAMMGGGAAAMLPMVVAIGFVEHLLYGVTVSALVYASTRKAGQ
ncbi:hypothetical protein HRbin01_01360 [archaeon HR01]|nr:hypothetical protein HRbin01_01360 [archaeon HR01]